MTRKAYELKLEGGKVVEWDSTDGGEAAAHSYAASHPGVTVVAWREPRHGMYPMLAPIKDAGQ